METENPILIRRDKILYYLSSQLALISGLVLGLYIYFTGLIIAIISVFVGLIAYVVLTYSNVPEKYIAKYLGYYILLGIIGSILAPLFETLVYVILAVVATALYINSFSIFENKEMILTKQIDVTIVLLLSYWAVAFFTVFLLITMIIG